MFWILAAIAMAIYIEIDTYSGFHSQCNNKPNNFIKLFKLYLTDYYVLDNFVSFRLSLGVFEMAFPRLFFWRTWKKDDKALWQRANKMKAKGNIAFQKLFTKVGAFTIVCGSCGEPEGSQERKKEKNTTTGRMKRNWTSSVIWWQLATVTVIAIRTKFYGISLFGRLNNIVWRCGCFLFRLLSSHSLNPLRALHSEYNNILYCVFRGGSQISPALFPFREYCLFSFFFGLQQQ